MKKKIAVLFGGCSTEYEVSLQSAYAVQSHIDRAKYDVALIGLERTNGQWYWYRGDTDRIASDQWFDRACCVPVFVPTDKKTGGLCYVEDGCLRVLPLDGVLPILHGKNGEDGTVQGALTLAGIPVIGCGLLSSALCMDKELAHRVASAAGVAVPGSFLVRRPYRAEEVLRQARTLGYPLFVKPVRSGSSFGITMVKDESALTAAVELAFGHDDTVIVEEEIRGREVGCAVLGGVDPMIGEVDEIELSQGFFDYTEKYTLKTSQIHVPARISADTAKRVKETALTIWRALGCGGFARVDMFLTDEDKIYFNEVNTIPGFTTHSRFPNMMKAAGLSFADVVNRILEEGL